MIIASTTLTITGGISLAASAAHADPPPALHVNFQPASGMGVSSGYTPDSGAAYNGVTGWQDATGSPLDLTANTRIRHSSKSPDVRYDTMLLMQAPAGSGTTTPGKWVAQLANGTYNVTVAVGDPTAYNSVNEITAQSGTQDAVTVIDHVTPTASNPWTTATKQVTVSNNVLSLDANGGTNTKIDFVDAVPVSSGAAKVAVSGPYDAVLKLAKPRLVFSTVQGGSAATPQLVTFRNSGGSDLTVTGFAFGGANGNQFALTAGQPTTLTIPAGSSQTVSVAFAPSAPTNCPVAGAPFTVADATRSGTLSFTTNDGTAPSGSIDLGGLISCDYGGIKEPLLDQVTSTLGYTTAVVASNATAGQRRNLGALRYVTGTDEVNSPYFTSADTSKPVTVTPVAHYSSADQSVTAHTGWYLKGSNVSTPCNAACNQLWAFPGDSATQYNQNQKLMPGLTGNTSFTPSGAFGIFSGDGAQVSFSDDSLNIAHTTSGADISPAHYMHNLRVYQAFGAGHVLIPNTFIIADDSSRTPDGKNADFQDVVFLLSNAAPAVTTAPTAGAATTHNLTSGGTVSPACAVTGFDGVLNNNTGTQCNPPNISFGSKGLTLASTAGQLTDGNQQNALYDSFNGAHGQFTVKARVAGPINYLSSNDSRVAAFYGPDSGNVFTVEVDRPSGSSAPQMTLVYSEKGVSRTIATVPVSGLATASTLDLIIVGNSSVPDPIPAASDTNKVRNYPLDQLTAYYSLNNAARVQIGTVQSPADLAAWFSTSAKAGILVSNAGNSQPFSATFASFAVTGP